MNNNILYTDYVNIVKLLLCVYEEDGGGYREQQKPQKHGFFG